MDWQQFDDFMDGLDRHRRSLNWVSFFLFLLIIDIGALLLLMSGAWDHLARQLALQ